MFSTNGLVPKQIHHIKLVQLRCVTRVKRLDSSNMFKHPGTSHSTLNGVYSRQKTNLVCLGMKILPLKNNPLSVCLRNICGKLNCLPFFYWHIRALFVCFPKVTVCTFSSVCHFGFSLHYLGPVRKWWLLGFWGLFSIFTKIILGVVPEVNVFLPFCVVL